MEQLLKILEKNARIPLEDAAAMIGKTTQEAAAMLDQARTLLAAALLAQYGQSPEGPDAALIVQLGKRLTKQRIMGTIELLQTYRGACSYNVGASHVLGALAVELEEIL